MFVVNLPDNVITTHCRLWPSEALHFVVIEEVAEWIEEQGMICAVAARTRGSNMLCDYALIFANDADGMLFKLTWL